MDSLLKRLHSPKNLKTLQDDVDNYLSNNNVTDEQKSLFSVNLLLEIQRCIEDKDWSTIVDPQTIFMVITKVSPHVLTLSDARYQNYLISTHAVYQFLLKKGIIQNDFSHLNFVFSNVKLEMKPKYYDMYWSMLASVIDSLSITDKNSSEKILSDLLHYLKKLIKICDVMLFCKKRLLWIVGKLFVLFNQIAPRCLEEVFKSVFECLNSNLNTSSSIDRDALIFDEIFKNILYSFSYLIQLISSNNFNHKNSIIALLKFSFEIFKRKKVYQVYLDILSSSDFFINNPHNGFTANHCNQVLNINNNITMKNSQMGSFQEFVLFIRKILSFKLSEWTKMSKEAWEKYMTLDFQTSLLQLMISVIDNLRKINKQGVKCNNCDFINGSHDAIQLATYGRFFIMNSTSNSVNLKNMIGYVTKIYKRQVHIVIHLLEKKCPSWEKFWSHIEKNLHNDAIALHSLKKYQLSLDMFHSYILCTELLIQHNGLTNCINFIRVLFNMAICQLDISLYEDALRNFYLSMALNSVHDKEASQELYVKQIVYTKTHLIKALNFKNELCKYDKALIECECFDSIKNVESLNVWIMCSKIINEERNGYYKLLNTADFGKLLLCELEILYSYWFSTISVAGICNALMHIFGEKNFNLEFSAIDSQRKLQMLIIMGKIITLIDTQAKKLHNPDIINFVRFCVSKYEQFFNNPDNCISKENEILLKLFFGNILMALYEITLYEKLNADKFSPLPTTAITSHSLISTHPDDKCDLTATHLSLRLSTEGIIVQSILKAIDVWNSILQFSKIELCKILQFTEIKIYIEKTFEIIESVIQILCLRGYDLYSIKMANILYSLTLYGDNKLCIIRTVGYVIENVSSRTPAIIEIISNTNKLVTTNYLKMEQINDPAEMDTILEYLLNLSIHYYNCNLQQEGILVLKTVQKNILNFLNKPNAKKENIHLSYAKLIDVQSLYINSSKFFGNFYSNESISYFTSLVNAYIEYSELSTSVGRFGSKGIKVLHLWIKSGLSAGKAALFLGLPRRTRSILKSLLSTVHHLLLPRQTIEILLILSNTDIYSEKHDDCKVKLDIVHYIMEERLENFPSTSNMFFSDTKSTNKHTKSQFETSQKYLSEISEHFEVVLDSNIKRNSNGSLSGSPTFFPTPFKMPSFIDHKKNCLCNKCTSMEFFSSVLELIRIKINLLFKNGEIHVMQSFINGGLNLLKYFNVKFNCLNSNFIKKMENFNFENIENLAYFKSLICANCHFLRDISFILIKENSLNKAIYLNKQIMKIIPLLPPSNFFLIQSVYEQKIFFLQSKIYTNETIMSNNMDQLANNISDALIITPQKSNFNIESFKTPLDRTNKPPKIHRTKINKGKILFEKNDIEEPNYCIPIIKLNLIDNDAQSPEKSDNINHKVYSKNIRNNPVLENKLKNPKITEKSKTCTNIEKTKSSPKITNQIKIPFNSTSKIIDSVKLTNLSNPALENDMIESNDVIKTRSKTKISSQACAKKIFFTKK